jgi:hypothetical protein
MGTMKNNPNDVQIKQAKNHEDWYSMHMKR